MSPLLGPMAAHMEDDNFDLDESDIPPQVRMCRIS